MPRLIPHDHRWARAYDEAVALGVGVVYVLLAWLLLTSLSSCAAQAQSLPLDTDAGGEQWLADAMVGVQSGEWWIVAAALLSAFVWLTRKVAARWLPESRVRAWLLSDVGGVVLTLTSAALGGVLHAAAADVPLGGAWLATALKVGLASMGGYTGLRRTLAPVAARLEREAAE